MRGQNFILGDETFTLVTPQDSDTTPAVFVNKQSSRATSPSLTLLSRPIQGDGLSTRTAVTFIVPVIRVIDGIDTTIATIPFNLTGKLPKEATSEEISAAVAQFISLLNEAQVKAVVADGERII